MNGIKNIRTVKVIQRADLNQNVIHINISGIRFSEQFPEATLLRNVILEQIPFLKIYGYLLS